MLYNFSGDIIINNGATQLDKNLGHCTGQCYVNILSHLKQRVFGRYFACFDDVNKEIWADCILFINRFSIIFISSCAFIYSALHNEKFILKHYLPSTKCQYGMEYQLTIIFVRVFTFITLFSKNYFYHLVCYFNATKYWATNTNVA